MKEDDENFIIGLFLGAVGLAVLADILKPKCPVCKEKIERNSPFCPACRTPLRWK